jgi:hypothetical protein
VQAFGQGLFGGRKCRVWRRHVHHEEEAFAAVGTWTEMQRYTRISERMAAERRARQLRSLFFALLGLGGLTFLYFFIRRRRKL